MLSRSHDDLLFACISLFKVGWANVRHSGKACSRWDCRFDVGVDWVFVRAELMSGIASTADPLPEFVNKFHFNLCLDWWHVLSCEWSLRWCRHRRFFAWPLFAGLSYYSVVRQLPLPGSCIICRSTSLKEWKYGWCLTLDVDCAIADYVGSLSCFWKHECRAWNTSSVLSHDTILFYFSLSLSVHLFFVLVVNFWLLPVSDCLSCVQDNREVLTLVWVRTMMSSDSRVRHIFVLTDKILRRISSRYLLPESCSNGAWTIDRWVF